MASIRIEDATITVEDTAQADREGRPVFEWIIKLDSGREWSAEDLRGPVIGPEPSEAEMVKTLLSFLSAACESREYRERSGCEGPIADAACLDWGCTHLGENEDMFPADLLDWAVQHSDEFAILSDEEYVLVTD